jgi:hypothetical protein
MGPFQTTRRRGRPPVLFLMCALAPAACAGDGCEPAPGADASPGSADARGGGSPGDGPPLDFHPVGEWQLASQPVTGPAMDLLALRYITIHYNGATQDLDGADDAYQDADFAPILRGMQSSYLSTRGYSLGYNSAIAPDGDEWEIRGLAYRTAANGCTDVNVPGYAIQITLPHPLAEPTDAQIFGARLAISRVRDIARAAGNADHLELNGHGDVRALCGDGGTACPGAALRELIASGALDP